MDKGLRRLIDTVARSRLCYGEPVRHGEVTVIPVARVRATGGFGFGRDRAPGGKDAGRPGEGGGGGGYLEGIPAGFIELGADGARFHEIPDPERTRRLVKAGATAIATVATGIAGARALRSGRRPAGLLGRGR